MWKSWACGGSILLQKWNFKKTREWHGLERIKRLQDDTINRVGTETIPTDNRIEEKEEKQGLDAKLMALRKISKQPKRPKKFP